MGFGVASPAQLGRRPSAGSAGSATSGSSISGCQRFSHSKETQRVVAGRREQREDPLGRELAASRAGPGATGCLPSARAPHVLQVDVAHERRRARAAPSSGSSPNSENAFAGSQIDAQALAARAARARERAAAPVAKSPWVSSQTSTPVPRRRSRSAASDSAIQPRVEARSAPGCTRSPKTRMPGAPRRGRDARPCARPPRRAARARPRRGGGRTSACRRRGRARPASASRARVSRRPLARELGPRPERVVALEEAQLDAVVAEAAGRVEDAGEGPGRDSRGSRRRADHVIRSSMRGRDARSSRARPRKKRSRVSRTMSAIARRTSTARRADVRREDRRPASGAAGGAGGSGSSGSVTSSAQRSRPRAHLAR